MGGLPVDVRRYFRSPAHYFEQSLKEKRRHDVVLGPGEAPGVERAHSSEDPFGSAASVEQRSTLPHFACVDAGCKGTKMAGCSAAECG